MSKPATPRQYAYLTTLLSERDAATTGVTDVPALIAALQAKPATTTDVSKLISTVQALPKPVVQAQAAAVRSNNYGGKCRDCGEYVQAGEGRIERKAQGKGWDTIHLAGQCVTPPEVGLYIANDGGIFKAYIGRMSRRLQVATLRIYSGEGTLVYVKGGVTILARLIAAGEARLMTQDEAATFGRVNGFCCNCGLPIEDDRSVASGYGPTCARNNGWHYCTVREAAAILGRQAIEAPANEEDTDPEADEV